jgi:potassium efflux system protein
MSRRPSLALLALLRATLALATPPAEPTPAPPPPAAAAAAAIPAAQIGERAAQTTAELREMRARATAAVPDLADLAAQVDRLAREAALLDTTEPTTQALDDLAQRLAALRDALAGRAQPLMARTDAIEHDFAQLHDADTLWTATETAARESSLPAAVRDTVRRVRIDIRDTRARLRVERDAALDALARLASLQARVNDALDDVAVARKRFRGELLSRDSPPLWTAAQDLGALAADLGKLGAGIARSQRAAATFVAAQSGRLAAQAIVFVAIVAGTLALSHRRRERAAGPAAGRRPLAAALVLGLLSLLALAPHAPATLTHLVALVAAGATLPLFAGAAGRDVRRGILVLAALLLAGELRQLLPPLAPTARLLLLAEDVGGGLWLALALRRRAAASPQGRAALVVGRITLALFAAAAAANLFGAAALAVAISDGVVDSALVAVLLLAAERVGEWLLREALESPAASRVRAVATRATVLERRAARALRLVLVVAWALVTLRVFALAEPLTRAARAALGARLTVGALSLSLGDAVAAAVTLFLSVQAARVVRALLEEDVLPRLRLARGPAAAISAGANYLILVVGVALALSAAGLDPGRLTLLAGALSVGVGFGLQNVVNNFVCGLILLLERPIQIGDIIGIGDVTGTVRRIGIRSSTIMTGDGAEMIVPNGDLIAQRVMNWTLSSTRRRFEVRVCVAYGAEPGRVLALLEQAARATPDVLDRPAPVALFAGFSPNGLELTLSAWTDRQDALESVRSRVVLAVHDALRTAGVPPIAPRA